MEHIGIDVHKRESQLCILTEQGEVVEKRIRTERGRFSEVFGDRARAKVLIEASTESEWVARCLEQFGHEVIVADPNFAPMYGMRTRRVKTDRRDARALADACLTGTYRKAHRTSEVRRRLKAQLAVREALVRQRAKHITLVGALVRQQGLRVGTGRAEEFLKRLEKVALTADMKSLVTPLLSVIETLNAQIQVLDAALERLAAEDAQAKRLRTVPSVGPVTAAAFVAAIDDATRFKGAHQVQAYLGPGAERDELRGEAAEGADYESGPPEDEVAPCPGGAFDDAPQEAIDGRAVGVGDPHRGEAGKERGGSGARTEAGGNSLRDDERRDELQAVRQGGGDGNGCIGCCGETEYATALRPRGLKKGRVSASFFLGPQHEDRP